MTNFRDIKREARRDLHQELQIPALYLVTPTSTPVPCTVRAWTKWGALGNLQGAPPGWGQMQETAPKLILVDPTFVPRNNALIAIERGEVYRIDSADPADDISITVNVTRLDPRNAGDKALIDTLPVPE